MNIRKIQRAILKYWSKLDYTTVIVVVVGTVLLLWPAALALIKISENTRLSAEHNIPTIEKVIIPAPATSVDDTAEAPAVITPESSTAPETPPIKSTSATKKATPAPTSPAAQPAFAISSVRLDGATYYCSAGSVIAQISSVAISANNSTGGSFTYKTEVSGGFNQTAPYLATGTIESGRSYTTLQGSMSPGFFYIEAYVRDGQSVRVHVTSPNDIASGWFSVPTGTQSSCAG